MNRVAAMARFAPTAAAAAALFGGAKMTDAPTPPANPNRGRLLGNVATADHAGAAGWALDEAHPDAPVAVELVDRGAVVARVVANLHRPDLAMAGVGAGNCGFVFRLRRPLSPGRDHVLQIRRVDDGADVPGSPLLLPRPAGTAADFDAALADATTTAATQSGRDDLATFLAGELDRLLDARAARPPVAVA
jgi:hypothetical protein